MINGSRQKPSEHLERVVGYTLQVAAESDSVGLGLDDNRLDGNALQALFRHVLHSHGIDSTRRLDPRLKANGRLADGFTPWFLLVHPWDLEAASKQVQLLIHTEPRRILASSHMLFSLQCLQARCMLGNTTDAIESALVAPIRLSPKTKATFKAAHKELPTMRASQLVVLQGGDPAFLHINGCTATLCGVRLLKLIGLPTNELKRTVLLLNTATPYFYVLSEDRRFVFLITPDGYVLCKMGRIECGFGMPANYIDEAYVLNGDFAQGSDLAVLMRDRFAAALSASGFEEESESTEDLYGYSKNFYNCQAQTEIRANPGVHCLHKWYRDTVSSNRYGQSTRVVAFDLAALSILDCPELKHGAAHFGISIEELLDHLEPMNVWVAASLPLGRRMSGYSDGVPCTLAKARFFLALPMFLSLKRTMAAAVPEAQHYTLHADSSEIDIQFFRVKMLSLQSTWLDDGILRDSLPISHALVDGLETWLHSELFNYHDESPRFRGPIVSVELFARVDFSTIYSVCILLKNDSSALLSAIYTDEDHLQKGYDREVLIMATAHLRENSIIAECSSAVLTPPGRKELLEGQGWQKGKLHHSDPSKSPAANHACALTLNAREGTVADSVLWNMVRASPCLVAGLCITMDPRKRVANNTQGFVWTYDNVCRAFALALVKRLGTTVVLDLGPNGEPGGTRDSQYRAIRAPDVAGLDWKDSASLEIARAENYLLSPDRASTRSQTKIINLKASVTYPPWVATIDAVARRHTLSGELETLISNFYTIDPDHRFYPKFKYPKGHRFSE